MITQISQIQTMSDGTAIGAVAGSVVKVEQRTMGQKNTPAMLLTLQDQTGSIRCTIFHPDKGDGAGKIRIGGTYTIASDPGDRFGDIKVNLYNGNRSLTMGNQIVVTEGVQAAQQATQSQPQAQGSPAPQQAPQRSKTPLLEAMDDGVVLIEHSGVLAGMIIDAQEQAAAESASASARATVHALCFLATSLWVHINGVERPNGGRHG